MDFMIVISIFEASSIEGILALDTAGLLALLKSLMTVLVQEIDLKYEKREKFSGFSYFKVSF